MNTARDQSPPMTPEEFLAAQLGELRELGYEVEIIDGQIVVRLTVQQAIFLQGVTVLAGSWS